MHTLVELRDYFIEQGIPARKCNGFQIRVGNDVWGMAHGDFYRNNVVTNPKDKTLIEQYKLVKPRKFKAMGSKFLALDGEDDAGLV